MDILKTTLIKSIDLRVKNIEASVNFYSDLLGFQVIENNNRRVLLSSDGQLPYLICLKENSSSSPLKQNSAGLYHIAFKFTSRKELARVFLRLFNKQIKFQGFSDHLVSESIYLSDPDGNGVELYADKPGSEWNWKYGQVIMDLLPLDLSVITSEIDDPEKWNGIHPETNIGHIHLKVTDLFKAEKFYNQILGLNISNSFLQGAMFFSTGGYHHHIAVNTWFSGKGKPASENSSGLIKFTLKMPDKNFLRSVSEKAAEYDLIIKSGNENDLCIKDFDGNVLNVIT